MGLKQKIKSMIQDCSICNKLKSNKEETKSQKTSKNSNSFYFLGVNKDNAKQKYDLQFGINLKNNRTIKKNKNYFTVINQYF